jgi:uncharacterized protein involved in response to NO
MIASGLLHLIRQSYWRSFSTKNIALLWSLHLANFSLGLGLILLGMSYLPSDILGFTTLVIPFGDSLHLITIAAMALMIFSMMSRVSLGHTGRALIPSKLVSWIFMLIILSALTRAILPSLSIPSSPMLPLSIHQPLLSWNISAFAWLIAGLLFLKVYLPILIAPKIDKSFTAK